MGGIGGPGYNPGRDWMRVSGRVSDGLSMSFNLNSTPPKSIIHFITSRKMAPSPLQQRRTHNTLLLQKLLNLRDGASPFTLALDSLEQRSGSVVREFVRRAKV